MNTAASFCTTAAPTAPSPALPSLYPGLHDCKCCGAPARLEGYADFDRDCYGANAQRGQVRGLPIPYYRCTGCDFGFTPVMDDWTPADFAAHVYNDEYALFDPNYATVRPHKTVKGVTDIFGHRDIRILDYGSGNGLTAGLLREAGYREVVAWDPFHGSAKAAPEGRFDLVLCIEVAEHHPRPLELFAMLASMVTDGGAVLLSTQDYAEVKGRWVDHWYTAPRNGHISLYSQRTLRLLAASLGRDYLKLDAYRHLLLPQGAASTSPAT
jgi:2-polyprenyl-6-hydroxyphenyl methylase/3-demethylubiquinone-9 3-methyltransferase